MQILCTPCTSDQWVKNGRCCHGHQRYQCKACGATFGEVDRRLGAPGAQAKRFVALSRGHGPARDRAIGGVSHNSVMNWVKSEIAGKALAKVDASAISFVEADKLWSYVGKKKSSLAVVGC